MPALMKRVRHSHRERARKGDVYCVSHALPMRSQNWVGKPQGLYFFDVGVLTTPIFVDYPATDIDMV